MAGQSERITFNTAEFERGMRKAIGELVVETEAQLEAVGLEIQNAGRRFAPVDTGRLRSSWKASGVKRDRRGSYIEVGTNVEYAVFVEFGTVHNRPQPFARPAFLEGIKAFTAKMRRVGR